MHICEKCIGNYLPGICKQVPREIIERGKYLFMYIREEEITRMTESIK